jgi:hypothetical protein
MGSGRYDTRLQQALGEVVVRPDKQKVVDEVWDAARIESFLHKSSLGGEHPEFSVLLHAYRSMRADDFQRFIDLFSQAGRDVGARNRSGQTLRECLADHRHAEPFRQILAAAGG